MGSIKQLEEIFVPRIPLGRMAVPSDVSRVIIFLLSDEARYITSTVLFMT